MSLSNGLHNSLCGILLKGTCCSECLPIRGAVLEVFNHLRIAESLEIYQSTKNVSQCSSSSAGCVCVCVYVCMCVCQELQPQPAVKATRLGQPAGLGTTGVHSILWHQPSALAASPTPTPAPGLRLAFCLVPGINISALSVSEQGSHELMEAYSLEGDSRR